MEAINGASEGGHAGINVAAYSGIMYLEGMDDVELHIGGRA